MFSCKKRIFHVSFKLKKKYMFLEEKVLNPITKVILVFNVIIIKIAQTKLTNTIKKKNINFKSFYFRDEMFFLLKICHFGVKSFWTLFY